MRVIYILNTTDPHGGSTKSFLSMITRLQQFGVIPFVIVQNNEGVCRQLEQQRIAYRALSYRLAVYPPTESLRDVLLFLPRLIGRLFLNWRASNKLCGIIREFKPDIVHTNVSVLSIGNRAARRTGVPHVWHIREYGDRDFNMHFYPSRRSHLHDLQAPGTWSICITRDVARYNQLTDNPTARVIYNGIVPAEEAAVIQGTKREDIFLYTGRIEHGKGITDLVSAFIQSLPRMQTKHRLLLVGRVEEPKCFNRAQQLIAQAHANDYIEFTGETSDIDSYMRKAKAVIVPSLSEGFGRVMPEAMWRGTPVIARNCSGLKEQFDNGIRLTGGEIGLRFDTTDELAEHIARIANEGLAPYSDMIERARTTVSTLYTNERYAEQVLAFYQEILDKKKR